jgi:hypothetical protein
MRGLVNALLPRRSKCLWFALGVLTGSVVLAGGVFGSLELSMMRVSHLYSLAVASPKTIPDLDILFARSQKTVLPVGNGFLIRYRFMIAEDIHVACDSNRNVLDIYPTFAGDWGRPWPVIHRVRVIDLRQQRRAAGTGTVSGTGKNGTNLSPTR